MAKAREKSVLSAFAVVEELLNCFGLPQHSLDVTSHDVRVRRCFSLPKIPFCSEAAFMVSSLEW